MNFKIYKSRFQVGAILVKFIENEKSALYTDIVTEGLYKREINLETLYIKLIQNNNIFILDDALISRFAITITINMIKK